MGETRGAGTTYPSGAPGFTLCFYWRGGVSCSSIFLFLLSVMYIIVCPFVLFCPWIYGSWLPYWYLQTFLMNNIYLLCHVSFLSLERNFSHSQKKWMSEYLHM